MNADLQIIKFAAGLYERLVKDFRKLVDGFVQTTAEVAPVICVEPDVRDQR